MQPTYDLELSSAMEKLLLLRFRLGCVDWLAIGNSAERAELTNRLDVPLLLLAHVYDAAFDSNLSLKVNVRKAQREAIEAAELWLSQSSADRPGARSSTEREAIWESQANAARRFEDDRNLKKVFKALNRQGTMAEFSGAYDNAVMEKDYVEHGDLSAIDALLEVRVCVTNSLLRCAREMERERGREAREPLLDLFQSSFRRTPEEMMVESDWYTTLTARLMLYGTAHKFVARAGVEAVDAAIAGADMVHRIMATGGPLSLERAEVSFDLMTSFETAANAHWGERVREDGPTLWPNEKRRINDLLEAIERFAPSTRWKSRARMAFQSELAQRWRKFERSVLAGQVVSAGALAFVVRLHAMLILTCLQLIQTAGKKSKTNAAQVSEEYEAAYQNATLYLFQESHSLGAASHLLRVGSHAISQRTAQRYSL